MVFKYLCILVLRTKVALALEGLNQVLDVKIITSQPLRFLKVHLIRTKDESKIIAQV